MHDRTNPSPVQVMPLAAKHGPVVERGRVRPPIPYATPSVPWATSTQDPDRALADLGGRFPAATIWFGEYTGSYWALIQVENATPRLIEAATPAELSAQLDSFTPRPPQHHQGQPSVPGGHHDNITKPAPVDLGPGTENSALRMVSQGRVRCRGRRPTFGTPGRSGRC